MTTIERISGFLARGFVTMLGGVAMTATLLGPLSAQAAGTSAEPAARKTAMERLAFMVGEWSGDAWAVTGPGTRLEVRQTESVRYALGGQVLLVEGVGRTLTDGMVGDTVFHAVATIDWVADRGYLMRSYTLAGHFGEFPIEVSDSGYAWGMQVPGGTVKYRMKITPDGAFDEQGSFITAAGREIPNFGMLLRRVAKR